MSDTVASDEASGAAGADSTMETRTKSGDRDGDNADGSSSSNRADNEQSERNDRPNRDRNEDGGRGGRVKHVSKEGVSVLVRMLPNNADRDRLHDIFSKYGEVTDVYIPLDFYTKRQRGIAFIQYPTLELAEKVVDENRAASDKILYDGEEVAVVFAKEQRKQAEDMKRLDRSRGGDRGGDRGLDRGGGRGGSRGRDGGSWGRGGGDRYSYGNAPRDRDYGRDRFDDHRGGYSDRDDRGGRGDSRDRGRGGGRGDPPPRRYDDARSRSRSRDRFDDRDGYRGKPRDSQSSRDGRGGANP